MPVHNLNEFKREVEDSKEEMRKFLLDKQVKIAAFAYDAAVTANEDVDAVDTGAFLAEIHITQNEIPVFEHPNRPGGERVFQSRKRQGLPPIFTDARSAGANVERTLREEMKLGDFALEDHRYYAEWLENGTSRMEPRRIFARAEAETSFFVRSLE